MTEEFSDLVMPIFRSVIDLKNDLTWNPTPPGLATVRQQTRSLIDTAEKKSRSHADLEMKFALVKYGLVAWIDEVLTNSSWGSTVGWGSQNNILEWDLYQTNLRAERFFRWADTAYQDFKKSRTSTDALEVYLLCVTLGFQGDLRFDKNAYDDWIADFYAEVSEEVQKIPKPFGDDPPGSTPAGLEPRRGAELLLRVSVLTAITAAVTLLGYLAAVHSSYQPA